jgi:Domain of unknown function (DUF5102)
MDDDLTFGVSVWGAPDEPIDPSSSTPFRIPVHPGTSDEFDDFGEPAPTTLKGGDDDDFGDFGDAEEAINVAEFGETVAFGEEVRINERLESAWQPLRLDPIPSREVLRQQIDDILEPIWADEDVSRLTTEEDIRQAEGISQILISSERFALAQ